MRIYIIGKKGFIGSNLCKLFELDGHSVCGHGRNEAFVDEECDLLIDATHQIGDEATREHAEKVHGFCIKNSIPRVVLLQSFASLEAKECSMDSNALNFGLAYSGCSNYGADKVEKEKVFIELFGLSDTTLELHYLPAVFGEGGAWSGLKSHIKTLYSENQTIYMPDLKAFFFTDIDLVYKSVQSQGKNKVNRYLIFDPESLTTSMISKLLPDESLAPVSYPHNSRLLYTFLLMIKILRHRKAFKIISGIDQVVNKLLAKRKRFSFPAFSYWDAFYFQDKWADKLLKIKTD